MLESSVCSTTVRRAVNGAHRTMSARRRLGALGCVPRAASLIAIKNRARKAFASSFVMFIFQLAATSDLRMLPTSFFFSGILEGLDSGQPAPFKQLERCTAA